MSPSPFAVVALQSVLAVDPAPSQEPAPSRTEVLDRIASLVCKDESRLYAFFDMHGNSCKEWVALVQSGSAATPHVIAEIESIRDSPASSAPRKHTTRRMLLRALGAVKDPASITWLESIDPDEPLGEEIDFAWMEMWRAGSWSKRWRGWYGFEALQSCLSGHDDWLGFFRKRYDATQDREARVRTLRIISWWLHADSVARFFRSVAKRSDAPEEVCIALAYLQDRGEEVDGTEIERAFTNLLDSDDSVLSLLEHAQALRHPALVQPLLASASSVIPRELEAALVALTFTTPPNRTRLWWVQWAASNEGRSSGALLESAAEHLVTAFDRDSRAGIELVGRACRAWQDPRLVVRLVPLVHRDDCSDYILGWAGASYAPAYREQIRGLLAPLLAPTRYAELRRARKSLVRALAMHPSASWDGAVKRAFTGRF